MLAMAWHEKAGGDDDDDAAFEGFGFGDDADEEAGAGAGAAAAGGEALPPAWLYLWDDPGDDVSSGWWIADAVGADEHLALCMGRRASPGECTEWTDNVGASLPACGVRATQVDARTVAVASEDAAIAGTYTLDPGAATPDVPTAYARTGPLAPATAQVSVAVTERGSLGDVSVAIPVDLARHAAELEQARNKRGGVGGGSAKTKSKLGRSPLSQRKGSPLKGGGSETGTGTKNKNKKKSGKLPPTPKPPAAFTLRSEAVANGLGVGGGSSPALQRRMLACSSTTSPRRARRTRRPARRHGCSGGCCTTRRPTRPRPRSSRSGPPSTPLRRRSPSPCKSPLFLWLCRGCVCVRARVCGGHIGATIGAPRCRPI